MMKTWAGQEDGQALVVVGMAMLLLVSALALGIDWGYGFVARRTAQNAADAASLAAGRALATSFVPGEAFSVTQQDVWAEACRASRTNTMSGTSALHGTVSVWFSSDPATTPFSEGPLSSWYGITAASDDCARIPPGNDDVLGNAVYVRVRVASGYRSLFGATTGQQIDVAADARVRLTGAGSTTGPVAVPLGPVGDATVGAPGIGLSGSTTAPNVAIWPIVIHYEPGMWTSPGSEIALIDWDSRSSQGQQDLSLFASFAHYSPHESVDVADAHQLISESDYTGHPVPHHGHSATALLPSAPGSCGGAPWDSFGSANLSRAATCDIPNWFYYGYRGSLSISAQWTQGQWRNFTAAQGGAEPPDQFPGPRSSCAVQPRPPYFTVPSCVVDIPSSSGVGDWVETVTSPQVDRVLVANEMIDFITRYGRVVPATGDTAVVVNVFLWDCGERFDPSADRQTPPGRWRPVATSTDCSALSADDARSMDRVHLFTVVPVTISLSDIDITQRRHRQEVYVGAHWGDAFGNAGSCASAPLSPGCNLNSLMNSAYLIPDE